MEVDPEQTKLIQAHRVWIGERVKALRLSRGLTQRMLSNRMGVHFTRVSDLESGTVDSKISSILRAAYAMNVQMGEFMKGCPAWDKTGRAAQKEKPLITVSMENLLESLKKAGLSDSKAQQVVENLAL